MRQKWRSYDIWFLKYQLQQTDFFSRLWPFFALSPGPSLLPLAAQKIKIWKKIGKKHLEISPLYTSVPKMMIIGYTVPEIWCVPDLIVIFHFELFFTLSPYSQIEKWKYQKTKEKLYDKIGDLSKITFLYNNNDTKMNPRVIFFFHIDQLITHPVVNRLPCSYVASLLAYFRRQLRVKRLISHVIIDYKTF